MVYVCMYVCVLNSTSFATRDSVPIHRHRSFDRSNLTSGSEDLPTAGVVVDAVDDVDDDNEEEDEDNEEDDDEEEDVSVVVGVGVREGEGKRLEGETAAGGSADGRIEGGGEKRGGGGGGVGGGRVKIGGGGGGGGGEHVTEHAVATIKEGRVGDGGFERYSSPKCTNS